LDPAGRRITLAAEAAEKLLVRRWAALSKTAPHQKNHQPPDNGPGRAWLAADARTHVVHRRQPASPPSAASELSYMHPRGCSIRAGGRVHQGLCRRSNAALGQFECVWGRRIPSGRPASLPSVTIVGSFAGSNCMHAVQERGEVSPHLASTSTVNHCKTGSKSKISLLRRPASACQVLLI